MAGTQRYAACGMTGPWFFDVKKNRTATPLDARPAVVTEDDEVVIGRVLPPQCLVACCEGQGYKPVIEAMPRRVAPAHGSRDWTGFQRGARPPKAI